MHGMADEYGCTRIKERLVKDLDEHYLKSMDLALICEQDSSLNNQLCC